MKFLKLKRLATSFNIFILVFLGFISGSLTHVNAADSGAVLPISRGGTGANSFANGQVLVGNGENSIITKGIDITPQTDSSNLITSGAVKTVANVAGLGAGPKNMYIANHTVNDAQPVVYLLGQTATKTSESDEYFNFIGRVYFIRKGDKYSIPQTAVYDLGATSAYSYGTTQINLNMAANYNGARELKGVTFVYNDIKYLGLYLLPGMHSTMTLEGIIDSSLGCISTEGLCTGRMFLFSEVSDVVVL